MNPLNSSSRLQSESRSIYNRVFWMSYLANISLVTANALTFRFAELIAFFGGTEQLAGVVVSTGMIGAVIARLFLGQALDRHGTRKLWALSSMLFIAGCSAFVLCDRISPLIFAARIAFATGLAGMFTSSIVHIQKQVPPHRRTEAIGNLGSSGFLGMIIGTHVADWISRSLPPGRPQFEAWFGGATVLGIVYLALVLVLTRHDVHCRPKRTPAAHRLIFRFWPGPVTLVAVMMGIGFAVTTVFLTRFATARNLSGIGVYFTGYAISAFTFRVAARNWSTTIGPHRMILMGLTGHCIGLTLLPFVNADWHFLIPATACGFGHAILFPAVVSLGSGRFPRRYRGTGTTIVLGFTEIGFLVSAPILGLLIDRFSFSTMFFAAAFTTFVVGVVYARVSARSVNPERGLVKSTASPKSIALQSDDDECQIVEPEPANAPANIVLHSIGRSV